MAFVLLPSYMRILSSQLTFLSTGLLPTVFFQYLHEIFLLLFSTETSDMRNLKLKDHGSVLGLCLRLFSVLCF